MCWVPKWQQQKGNCCVFSRYILRLAVKLASTEPVVISCRTRRLQSNSSALQVQTNERVPRVCIKDKLQLTEFHIAPLSCIPNGCMCIWVMDTNMSKECMGIGMFHASDELSNWIWSTKSACKKWEKMWMMTVCYGTWLLSSKTRQGGNSEQRVPYFGHVRL